MASEPPNAAPIAEQTEAISSSAWNDVILKCGSSTTLCRISVAGVIGYEPRNTLIPVCFAAVAIAMAMARFPVTLR